MQQEYSAYTADDFSTWATLYTRQIGLVHQTASVHHLEGLQKVQFSENKIPDFRILNETLLANGGWRIHVVPGLIDNKSFFELLLAKQFCSSTWLRPKHQLDYLEEPDMFHDIFGHVPLLTNEKVSNFLRQLANIALKYIDSEEAIEAIARIYWYIIEFGMIYDPDRQLKVFGSGILSSVGETKFCVSSEAVHVPFNTTTVVETPYIKDKFQAQYFVLDSIEQLTIIPQELEAILEKKMVEMVADSVL